MLRLAVPCLVPAPDANPDAPCPARGHRSPQALCCPLLPGPVPCLRSHERVCATARRLRCGASHAEPSYCAAWRRATGSPSSSACSAKTGRRACVRACARVSACVRAVGLGRGSVGPVRRRRALWSTASLSRCNGHSPPCSAVLIAPLPPRHHCQLPHGTGPARVTLVRRSRPMALGCCLRSVRSSGPARRARRRSARRWAASCGTIRCRMC
jgi:hypothetical protein